jgi:hypothetical protein
MSAPSTILHPPSSQLGLFEVARNDVNVQWLEKLLSGAQCWMTAADIALSTHGRVGDRDLRALASASEWIISGQKGYKHLEHASPEEIAHARNWLISQGKKMIRRGIAIGRNAHRRLG